MFIDRFYRRCAATTLCLHVVTLSLGATFFLTGCGEKSGPTESSTHHYEARGLVRGLPPDHKTVDIQHEGIPAFMPSMTMPFEVGDEKEIADLKIGDAISFRLNVTQRDSWIDRIEKIDAGQVHLPTPPRETPGTSDTIKSARLKEGNVMPDFHLIAQDGKPVGRETFHGHPFLLTFIFTRCPIPNFCPRMSQNFAELQKAIQNSSDDLAAVRLLSVSFDPKFDTPEILKQYAGHEGADPAIWTFATGDPVEVEKLTKAFSIFVQPEGGTISHSLATALIDREGKVAKIWRGNGWTPGEVIQEIEHHEK